MHPLASTENCSGKVIDSHTVQRKGSLRKIVDEKNHVCQLFPSQDGKEFFVKEIGWKKATTFPGFCSKHDAEAFQKLELEGFHGAHDQCVLQAFRNLCNELYRKSAFIESLEAQLQILDRGFDLNRQIDYQFSARQNIKGQKRYREELQRFWCIFENALIRQEFNKFLSKVYFFEGELSVVSSVTLPVGFDFLGNKLSNQWSLLDNVSAENAEMISHSVMAADSGGAIVFCWPAEHKKAEQVVSSFDSFISTDQPDIFMQYSFLNSEMNFFSRAWWDGLSSSQQSFLKKLAGCFYYDGGAFTSNRNKLVNWVLR